MKASTNSPQVLQVCRTARFESDPPSGSASAPHSNDLRNATLVIGHSVDANLRRTVIAELRRECPDCIICFVYVAPHKEGEALADVSLDVTRGAEPLVLALQERLPKTTGRGA